MNHKQKHRLHTRRGFLGRMFASLALPALCAQRGVGAVAKKPLPQFDLKFIDGKVPLMRRSEWTDDSPRVWLLREGGKFDRITIHHQGGPTSISREKNTVVCEIDAVYGGHKRKRYGDIAYHFIVDYAGCVWEGRSLAYEGAHVSHQNKNNLGILVLGNFEKQTPSAESLASIDKLTKVLRGRFGIKHHRVYGHCDIGSSLCPGKNLYPHVAALRNGTLNNKHKNTT